MINSAHIFKSLAEVFPTLQAKYQDKDVFYIALRLENRSTAKVEVHLEDLTATLFNIIDTNNNNDIPKDCRHAIWNQDEYKGQNLLSVFICDSTSQVVFDSSSYQQQSQKYALKRDKDIRVLQFGQLDEKNKEQVVDMLATQLSQIGVEDEKQEQDEGNNTSLDWGKMPWD